MLLPANRGVRIVSHASPPPEAPDRSGGLWIDTLPRPGWQNMAIDHAMFDWAEATGGQLWRLYRWEPHCLSFGRHEPAARRYDRTRIDGLGIDCVRRPTGGRGVWHARELTYAVAAPVAAYGSLQSAYRAIHEVLARAVAGLGAAADLADDRSVPGLGSGPCFAAAVGGEIVVGGKKVLGSAQRRGDTALLQHGSLLLEDDQSLVRSVHHAAAPPEAPEAPLSAILGRTVSFASAADAVSAALAEAGLGPAPLNLTDAVLQHAALHYDRYRSDTWTWER